MTRRPLPAIETGPEAPLRLSPFAKAIEASALGVAPRLFTRMQAATYGGISAQSLSEFAELGRTLHPIAATLRCDLKTTDHTLDFAEMRAERTHRSAT